MVNRLIASTAVIALSCGMMATLSLPAFLFSAEPSFAAGNGNNGNGNRGNGNNGNDKSNGNGAIASALGGLNAAHANANALANASANSRVGLVATYQREAMLTNDLAETAETSLAALKTLAEIAGLDPAGDLSVAGIEQAILDAPAGADLTALGDVLAAAQIYEANDALIAPQEGIEAAALEAAANKEVPTGAALDALRDMLGL